MARHILWSISQGSPCKQDIDLAVLLLGIYADTRIEIGDVPDVTNTIWTRGDHTPLLYPLFFSKHHGFTIDRIPDHSVLIVRKYLDTCQGAMQKCVAQ